MKSAEDYLKDSIDKYNKTVQPIHSFRFSNREVKLFSEMINEARKEALEEAARELNMLFHGKENELSLKKML